MFLPVPGAGKIYWGHGLSGDSTGAVPGQDTDHVLSVVGRGEDASQGRYWIVRYSWGEYCDELSYVRVVFGALNVESQCSWGKSRSVLDRALSLGRILRRVGLRSRGVWRSEC